VTQSTQLTERVGRYRWVVCALLFFATTINYMDRQVISILKPVLETELHWSDPQSIEREYSYIVMAFTLAYAFGVLLFGWIIDKVGTKIGYAVSVVIWGLSSMSHALARTSIGFGVARVGLGLGESGNFPAAIKTVAEWFPKRERALATGIFNSGANVGALLAPVVIPWAIYAFAADPRHPFWQIGFIITGVLDFTWLVFWLAIYQKPSEKKGLSRAEFEYIHSDIEEQQATKEKIRWGTLLTYRQTWAVFSGKFLTDCVWWFYLFWLPSYLKDKYHVDIKNIAKFALPLIIIYSMTTVGSVGGGWLSSRFIKNGWSVNRARKTAMFAFAVAVLPITAVKYVSLWPAVLLVGVAAAAHQAWSANIFTTASDMFPKKAVASVTGIGAMAGAVGGLLFQWLTGMMLAAYKASGDIQTGYSILFAICASAYLAALLLFHIFAPKMSQVRL
jgi:ACS family hexuronate transporter-like MFS transporter